MTKYSYEIKKKIVLEYLSGKGGYKYLAQQYGIPDHKTIQRWVTVWQILLCILNRFVEHFTQYNDTQIDHKSCECIVAKNSHGETTSVMLEWQSEFMRFKSVE